MEIWKEVKGFEGYYEVSNFGNVKSLNRTITDKNGVKYNRKEILLKQVTNRLGYKVVTLQKNGKRYFNIVHRLVAIAFIDNPNKLKEVNHIDFDKSNNSLDNLEWCSRSYNINHYFSNKKTTSKYKGVSYQKERNKWTAYVNVNGKRKNLGRFDTEEEANNYKLKFIENYGIEKKSF